MSTDANAVVNDAFKKWLAQHPEISNALTSQNAFTTQSTVATPQPQSQSQSVVFNPPISISPNGPQFVVKPAIYTNRTGPPPPSQQQGYNGGSVFVVIGETVMSLVFAFALRQQSFFTNSKITVYVLPQQRKDRLLTINQDAYNLLVRLAVPISDKLLTKCCFGTNSQISSSLSCSIQSNNDLQQLSDWKDSVLFVPESQWMDELSSGGSKLGMNIYLDGATYVKSANIDAFIKLAKSQANATGYRYHLFFTDMLYGWPLLQEELFVDVKTRVVPVDVKDRTIFHFCRWTISTNTNNTTAANGTYRGMIAGKPNRINVQTQPQNTSQIQVLLTEEEYNMLLKSAPNVNPELFTLSASVNSSLKAIGFSWELSNVYSFLRLPLPELGSSDVVSLQVGYEMISRASPVISASDQTLIYLLGDALIFSGSIIVSSAEYISKIFMLFDHVCKTFNDNKGQLTTNDVLALEKALLFAQNDLFKISSQSNVQQDWTNSCTSLLKSLPEKSQEDLQAYWNVSGDYKNDAVALCNMVNPAFAKYLSDSGQNPKAWQALGTAASNPPILSTLSKLG